MYVHETELEFKVLVFVEGEKPEDGFRENKNRENPRSKNKQQTQFTYDAV